MERKNTERFFQNRECPYFPCHPNADPDIFNCLFCYCPLYALGEMCGGNFSYTELGIKDCTNCLIPHTEGGYDYIVKNISRVIELGKKK